MILLIDNYDSFVFNLARYVQELGERTVVIRNDAISLDEIRGLAPRGIIISPGPCTPAEAGISTDVIFQFGKLIPILGVCLGHQCIGQAYGGKIGRAIHPMHGKASVIQHDHSELFGGVPNPLVAGRYHSLAILDQELPDDLIVTARSEDGEIMGVKHRHNPVFGVQFHPESVLTENGHAMIRNFLALT